MKHLPEQFNTRQHMLRNDFEAFYYSGDIMHPVAPHAHNFYELIFFIEGNVTYMIEGRSYPLQSGDLLIIPASASHHPVFEKPTRFRRVVLWVTEAFVRTLPRGEELSRCFPQVGGTYLHRFSPADRERLLDRAMTVAEEFSYSRPFGDTMSLLLVTELFILIWRMMAAAAQSHPADTTSEQLVQDVVRFINANLARELPLDYIADHFFISKFYLSRVFKRHMNTTPHSYITQRRLAMAKHLLYDGLSPTEVYRRCGFADYSSFYRAFREQYGTSPKHLCLREQE